jgi:hypothetical protein
MKETEKHIGNYLLVYFVVLFICGFFQYMAICQGKSLECAFSMSGINTIVTTTAYVLTPIVAIIAIISWKHQKNFQTGLDFLDKSSLSIFNFNRDIELICKKILEINSDYTDKNFNIMHSIFREKISLTDDNLKVFYCHITQYTNFNEDFEFQKVVEEFYEISNELLFTNKYLVDEYYLKAYEILKNTNKTKWYDEKIVYLSTGKNQTYKELDYYMNIFHTTINSKIYVYDKVEYNYEELYKKYKNLYSKISTYIMENMKA